MIAIFVAIAKNNVIGSKNDLPWYIPEDLKRFKALTTGHTVVMGRKTYDSIIKRLGKPLPNRKNVVITSQKDFAVPEGVEVFGTLDEAFHAHEKDEIIFAIGGARIFAEALPKADRLYITHVDKEYEGDVYFPEVDWTSFSKVKEEQHDGFSFADYHRIKKIA
jgi:dihydrofolate reductase